jgi:hypothetical protein
MEIFEWILFTILGLVGVVYAVKSYDMKLNITKYLPGKLSNQKILFIIGFAIVMVGFALSYLIGSHHGFITLTGTWIMLLGSAPWFNRRVVRKSFDPGEWKVIRSTIYAGILLVLLSTGLFYFPPVFSPGTFLMGISIAILAGRLWWHHDLEAPNRTMVFSKRDYS